MPNDVSQLDNEELLNLQDTQIKNIILSDIDTVWLNRYQVIFDRQNSNRTKLYYQFPYKSKEYRIFISNDKNFQVPTLEVEIIN